MGQGGGEQGGERREGSLTRNSPITASIRKDRESTTCGMKRVEDPAGCCPGKQGTFPEGLWGGGHGDGPHHHPGPPEGWRLPKLTVMKMGASNSSAGDSKTLKKKVCREEWRGCQAEVFPSLPPRHIHAFQPLPRPQPCRLEPLPLLFEGSPPREQQQPPKVAALGGFGDPQRATSSSLLLLGCSRKARPDQLSWRSPNQALGQVEAGSGDIPKGRTEASTMGIGLGTSSPAQDVPPGCCQQLGDTSVTSRR